ncbi:MAG: right-handed parallel beta-helix repeat-containing protein, partial [Clostridiales bacterium]
MGFYNVGGSSIIFANRFHNNKQVGLKNSSNAYDQISYNHFMNNTEIALQVCGNMYFRIFQNVLEGSKKGIYCQDCQKALVLDNTVRRAWD